MLRDEPQGRSFKAVVTIVKKLGGKNRDRRSFTLDRAMAAVKRFHVFKRQSGILSEIAL